MLLGGDITGILLGLLMVVFPVAVGVQMKFMLLSITNPKCGCFSDGIGVSSYI